MSKKTERLTNDVLPEAEFLTRLSEDYAADLSDSASARQSISTSLKNAEKEHNVHMRAFKQAHRLRKMDATHCAAELRHLLHYIKAFGLNDQQDMYDDTPDESFDAAMSAKDDAALEDATVN